MPLHKPVISPPWGGWNDSMPPNIASMNSFSQITNWLINKGRIFSFPNRAAFPPSGIVQPGGLSYPFLGLRSFQDGLGNYHTAGFVAGYAMYFDVVGNDWAAQVWVDASGNNRLQMTPVSYNPYSTEIVFNKLFFSNGGPPLSYMDGGLGSFVAGDVPGSCYFLGKLAGHLMMINTIEPVLNVPGSTAYTGRVRWSMENNPLVWVTNPVTGIQEFTAGSVDLTDVEDQLTGWATINSIGYAFRNSGITTFTPTGVAANPFQIENFSIGPAGVGNMFPYCLAVYGTRCVFPAEDDIYMFDGTAPTPIGGAAKRSIYPDLVNASGQCIAFIIGRLFSGVDYLSYWLLCPQQNNSFTSAWIYHFDDGTWVNEQLNFGGVTAANTVAIS